jgi:hypothetical protein
MDLSVIPVFITECYILVKGFGPERVGWNKEIWTPSSLSCNIADCTEEVRISDLGSDTSIS